MNNFYDEIIDNLIIYINNPNIKEKIHHNIIDPLISNIQQKTYNYFVTIISLYTIIILLQLIILSILLSKKIIFST